MFHCCFFSLHLFQFLTSTDNVTSLYSALISRWQVFYTRYMHRSRGWGQHGPVLAQTIWNDLWPQMTPRILSIPRFGHQVPPHISKTFLGQCLRRVVLRKVYSNQVVNGRVTQGQICTEPSCAGACCLGLTFQGVIIEGRIVIGQIVQKRIVQGLMVRGRCVCTCRSF